MNQFGFYFFKKKKKSLLGKQTIFRKLLFAFLNTFLNKYMERYSVNRIKKLMPFGKIADTFFDFSKINKFDI